MLAKFDNGTSESEAMAVVNRYILVPLVQRLLTVFADDECRRPAAVLGRLGGRRFYWISRLAGAPPRTAFDARSWHRRSVVREILDPSSSGRFLDSRWAPAVVNLTCQAWHAPTERSVYTVSGGKPHYPCRNTGGTIASFFSGLSAGFGRTLLVLFTFLLLFVIRSVLY